MGKWEAFEKLPRPLLRWVCLIVTLWTAVICDVAGLPQDATVRGLLLAFVCGVYGIRAVEKLKGLGA